jgi:hypothetical protein
MSRYSKKMWRHRRILINIYIYIHIHTLLTSAKSKQTTVADNNPGNPYIEILQHPKTKSHNCQFLFNTSVTDDNQSV